MNSSPSETHLAALFRQAASAHHRTFGDIEPEGHDWVPWYAEYLAPRLEQMLDRPFDALALAADLRIVDAEQRTDTSGLPWPEYYARWFMRRLT